MTRRTHALIALATLVGSGCGREEVPRPLAAFREVPPPAVHLAPAPKTERPVSPPAVEPLPPSGTAVIDGVEVSLFAGGDGARGDLLVLPGWNFGRLRWCEDSSLCEKARQAGYRLVLPEMGKSVYAGAHFPETRDDWRKTPTLTWLTGILIPELQRRHGLFRGPDNYLVGLSTGARGVVLIAMATGTLFRAGAALSGDYDQTKAPGDRLMTGFYGPFSRHRERWATVDNPSHDPCRLRVPVYFGHGTRDRVVPVSQTRDFFALLERTNPSSGAVLHLADAGHDFASWDAEVDAILAFFDRHRGPREPPAP